MYFYEGENHFLILMMTLGEFLLIFKLFCNFLGASKVVCNFLLLLDELVLVVCVFDLHDLSDVKVIVPLMLFRLFVIDGHERPCTIASHFANLFYFRSTTIINPIRLLVY